MADIRRKGIPKGRGVGEKGTFECFSSVGGVRKARLVSSAWTEDLNCRRLWM